MVQGLEQATCLNRFDLQPKDDPALGPRVGRVPPAPATAVKRWQTSITSEGRPTWRGQSQSQTNSSTRSQFRLAHHALRSLSLYIYPKIDPAFVRQYTLRRAAAKSSGWMGILDMGGLAPLLVRQTSQ